MQVSITQGIMANRRIFVSIASYRDRECQWTIKDLFEKADHPDRIVVGLCSQVVPEEDGDCFLVSTRPQQCREFRVEAADSKGACWARHKIISLWQEEEYFLQIDSHMRFVPRWDEKLFAALASCPTAKPIISTYAIGYDPPDRLHPDQLVIIEPREFDARGILKTTPTTRPIDTAPAIPAQNPFCSGHFLFGPSQVIVDVPPDPHIYLANEEVTLAPRLWTSGWDIHVPNQVIMYHDFGDRGRRKHWDDRTNWRRAMELSAQRVLHLLAGEPCQDTEALHDIERYGLGRERSLDDYQAFSGVDFRHRLINGRTIDEIAMATSPQLRRTRTARIFRGHWKRASSDSVPRHDGPQAQIPATAAVRAHLLRRLFLFLDIKVVADAGCGDFSWMSLVSPSLQEYRGFDIVDELIEDLSRCFGDRREHSFTVADITLDSLPTCDAILCRDVLTRLPLPYVASALTLFRASGTRYLIATTHAQQANKSIAVGGSQALTLTAAPFRLPLPMIAIPDPKGSNRMLGVWRMTEIPNTLDALCGSIS